MTTRKRRGFTLIEVIAALGIIVVLTLVLVATIQAQLAKANQQRLESLVGTVNTQILVAYQQVDRNDADFLSTDALVKADIVTDQQWQQLAGKVRLSTAKPPVFSLISP